MDDIPQIEARFCPTYQERLLAEWQLLIGSPKTLLAGIAFPAAGLWLFVLLFQHPDLYSAWSLLVGLACFAFTPFFFFLNSYRAQRISVKNGPFTYAFDAEGVHVSTPLARSSHLWPAITRVRATRGMLFIYFSKRCAHFIPLRALPASDAVVAIQNLASAGGASRVA